MKIPKVLYGSLSLVQSRCSKLAKQVMASGDFETFDPGPFVDTSEVAGILYLRECRGIPGGEKDFHCEALTMALMSLASG